MHYIAIAENAHDSCITVADRSKVLLHLELERFFNVKRYRLKNINTLLSLISLLRKEYFIENNICFILSRHNGERLYQPMIDSLSQEYKEASIIEVEHLDSHAAFCYLSGFKDALVIAIDGGGDRRINLNEPNFLAYYYKDKVLKSLDITRKPNFDGRVWSIVSRKLFNDSSAAGKVMGIAAYGKFSCKYEDVLFSNDFKHLDRVWDEKIANNLCEQIDVKNFDDAADLSYTLQEIFTQNLIETLSNYRDYSDNLVLVGGCALNIITNSEVGQKLNYKNVYVPPCPGDEGQSLGALLYYCGYQNNWIDTADIPYLGRGSEYYLSETNYKKLVSLILDQKTVAWHMGRAEIGPRALGHRSLLALPTQIAMKKLVSEVIKKRESFRPVAPIVLEEYASEWFDFKFSSPYMSFTAKAKPKTKELVPAVVHQDGTSRFQTLSRQINPELHELISQIYSLTGIPMLINTSLNVAGLPICDIEQHSKEFYVTTPVDVLNLNGCIYIK